MQASHHVKYHRVEPARYVACIEVQCTPIAHDLTEATTGYSFVGLSESGNREIAAMTQETYDAKMARWTDWINSYFRQNRPSQGSAKP